MLQRSVLRLLLGDKAVVVFQVVNKLLALAMTASQQKFTSNTWSNMLLSTSSVCQPEILCTVAASSAIGTKPHVEGFV